MVIVCEETAGGQSKFYFLKELDVMIHPPKITESENVSIKC